MKSVKLQRVFSLLLAGLLLLALQSAVFAAKAPAAAPVA